jgi:hypothetical protein
MGRIGNRQSNDPGSFGAPGVAIDDTGRTWPRQLEFGRHQGPAQAAAGGAFLPTVRAAPRVKNGPRLVSPQLVGGIVDSGASI